MKNLKLLNNKFIITIFTICILISAKLYADEAKDIWSLNNEGKNQIKKDENNIDSSEINVLDEKKNIGEIVSYKISEDHNIDSKKLEILGLYDPGENNFKLNMWVNSDGEKIDNLIKKLNKLNLSQDAKEIYNKVILTNSLAPKVNISANQFNNYKINWLIKNKDLNLIKEFVIKNNFSNINDNLITFYLDHYLSLADLQKACEIFKILDYPLTDKYLLKYKIYCLFNKDEQDQAQLNLDLLKEEGFKDKFFEDRLLLLMGYNEQIDNEVSDKNLLDFHLSHRTNNDGFEYEPSDKTADLIWKYLASSNLLIDTSQVDLENSEKILSIEKATHSGNYEEEDLFNLYKRFKFSIDQLITVEDSYKLLSEYERRALLYQGIIIHSSAERKIQLIKILLDEFKKSKIDNAFNKHLVKILKEINIDEVPSNHISFYDEKLESAIKTEKNIKFNNKILHQSKLLNYFFKEIKKEKVEKELENILKKLVKDKNYYFTTKDFILIESLINDGIKVPEKYISLLELYTSNIPTDIQVMLNDDESGMILLRLVEIIGEDNFKDLGSETQYFIIATLNKLNSNKLRNELILKILPFKV